MGWTVRLQGRYTVKNALSQEYSIRRKAFEGLDSISYGSGA